MQRREKREPSYKEEGEQVKDVAKGRKDKGEKRKGRNEYCRHGPRMRLRGWSKESQDNSRNTMERNGH